MNLSQSGLASNVTVPGNSFAQIAVASTGQLVFATGGANSARVRFARVRRDGALYLLERMPDYLVAQRARVARTRGYWVDGSNTGSAVLIVTGAP